MLAPAALESLDSLIWLGSGHRAAQHCLCSQSVISRRAALAAGKLGVRLRKIKDEWDTVPHSHLLSLERRLHQLCRFLQAKRLRLESDHWVGREIMAGLPNGWSAGRSGRIGIQRPLRLLRERVIDAWISSSQPDLPSRDDPVFIAYEIANMPLYLASGAKHPLAGEKGLSTNDLLRYPSLGLGPDCYPRFGRLLAQQGLWNDKIKMDAYEFIGWEGRATTGLATVPVNSLSTDLSSSSSSSLSVIDWRTGINDCIALIVRRDLAEEPEFQHLLEHLRSRAGAMARHNQELTVLI